MILMLFIIKIDTKWLECVNGDREALENITIVLIFSLSWIQFEL